MRSTAARNAGGSTRRGRVASRTNLSMASTAPLRSLRGPRSMPDSRVVAENSMKPLRGGASGIGIRYFSCVSATIERPSGVSSARLSKQRRFGRLVLADAGHGDDFRRQTVAEGDGAGLVEQEGIDIARRLNGAPRHGKHVEFQQPVHAGDADGGQQPADGGRNERDEQRDKHGDGKIGSRIGAEALQGHNGDQEDDGHAGEQDAERDLVGRLLPLGAFDERNHAIEEGRSGRRRDAHNDPVGDHGGAAGDRRAVAAGLADDGRGFARHRGLVDGGDASHNVAVAGDEIAGFDEDDVARPQVER